VQGFIAQALANALSPISRAETGCIVIKSFQPSSARAVQP
jgi:hypothetical protein